MKKKSGQFNFGWLFAIIVGGAILFFAIYGAMKTGDTQRYQSDTQVARSISILTDPLQAGFSQGSYGSIHFREITRINNLCYDNGFGRNDLSVSTRSDIGQEWNMPGSEASVHNKYIFSPENIQGKDFYVFSKPLELPYKIADLVFLISDNYCFTEAPEDIVSELSAFNIPNIQINNCTLPNQTKVCFVYKTGCDILVNTNDGKIIKKQEELYFQGRALMYAGIFSDKRNYICNTKRLLYRGQTIAEELIKKSDIMSSRGCQSSLKQDLVSWKLTLNNTSPDNLADLHNQLVEIENKNEKEQCSLW